MLKPVAEQRPVGQLGQVIVFGKLDPTVLFRRAQLRDVLRQREPCPDTPIAADHRLGEDAKTALAVVRRVLDVASLPPQRGAVQTFERPERIGIHHLLQRTPLDIALPHAMVGERLPNSSEHPHLEIEDDHRDVRKLLPDGAIEVLAATNGLGSVLVQTGRRS
jgi:hypothetical protein